MSELTDQLNDYTGDNIWQDIIYPLPDYDPELTLELDPNYRNDVVALTDGTVIKWDGSRDSWEEEE
jgi:hypothetical protein